MSTLPEFLLARIAEDEAGADEHHVDTCDRFNPPGFPCDCGYPARVLAECAAKRRIVERCAPYLDPFSMTAERACTVEAALAEDMLCDLGDAYADHPDYRPEWKL